MNDREEESKDAIDEKFSRILPIIKLPKGYYEYDLYEPIGDTFNEFYEPEISKSELEAILEAEKRETCYKELETRWKEENEDVILLDEKSCYKLPDIKLLKGYYLFDLYEEEVRKVEKPWEYYDEIHCQELMTDEVRKVEEPWEYYPEVIEALWENENEISNEYYDGLSEAEVKTILESEYKEEETRLKEKYEEMSFDFEYSDGFLIEELGDYDLMKYYCEEEAEPRNGNSKLCHNGIEYLTQEEYEAQLDRFSDYELFDDDLSEEQLEDLEKMEEFLKEEEPWEYYHEVLEAYWIETETWEYYPEVLEALWKEDYGEVVEPHKDNDGGEGMLKVDNTELKPQVHCEWDNIFKKISTESLTMCKNESQGLCNKNVHNLMLVMGASESYNYKGGLFQCPFIFYWNSVPGDHTKKLKYFLNNKYNIEWVKYASVVKFGDFIRMSTNNNYLTIFRYCKDKARLTIDYKKIDTFYLEQKGDRLCVYHKNYPIFEGDECKKYIHEYVPLHLPQIVYVLRRILQKTIFEEAQSIKILDIGTGPATVPLAFCRLKKDSFKNRNFEITTVEASKTFNNIIRNFKNSNENKSIEIVNILDCEITNFMYKPTLKSGVDWIILANSLSAISKDISRYSGEDAAKVLNKFICSILLYNKKINYNNKLLMTIIEGSNIAYFNSKDYLNNIEKIGFTDLKIVSIVHKDNLYVNADWIKNCIFYKTKFNLCKPVVITASLLVELKK